MDKQLSELRGERDIFAAQLIKESALRRKLHN